MTPPDISIDIQASGQWAYKSISSLNWSDIPALAILTGLNGASKTQLLELLAFGLSNTTLPNGKRAGVIKVEGQDIEAGAVAYLPSHQQYEEGQHASITSLRQLKINMYQQMLQTGSDIKMIAKRNRVERELNINLANITPQDFADKLPDTLVHILNDFHVVFELAHVFTTYVMRTANIILKGGSLEDTVAEEGAPPWDIINEDLASVAFPFRVNRPVGEIYEPFELKLIENVTGKLLKPSDLSSGEKLILETVLWLFISRKRTAFPKLFLMDEPDAHLHPQMTAQFLAVVEEVLVKKHGVRVIMTTHSPSTVALAPERSIFEMQRGTTHIKKVTRAEATSLLTAGLVTISPGTKHVIVEDEGDVDFYSTIRDILSDYGPRKDVEALASTPSILFMPASVGRGQGRVPGGCTVVYNWVAKMDADPLKALFRGIVDKDINNHETDRVFITKRYSIENYLLDPFNVYAVLLQANTAPPLLL